MAILSPEKRMVFWEIKIAGFDMTTALREYLNDFSVTYKLNGMTKASLSIVSESYIEDILVEGQTLDFSMGYDAFFLVPMFSGKITKPPQGAAGENITYRIEAQGKEISMTRVAKTRVFQVPNKQAVISQIAAENGYIPIVTIQDTLPIEAKYMPIQKNKTDMQFLIECAERWNCVFWINGFNLYFYDADLAHAFGNVTKTPHIDDLLPFYELGYRTDYSKNNIAKISWQFRPQKGGGTGGRSNTGADETGTVVQTDDFSIDYNGKIYVLKPALLKAALKDFTLFFKYSAAVLNAGVADAELSLKEYFVPVTHGSPTNKNLSSHPAHKAGAVEVTVDMNIGDPYLRPPRDALLYSGSLNPLADKSDLPNFLFRHTNPQKYKINEVTTSYKSGKIDTKITMTLGRADI